MHRKSTAYRASDQRRRSPKPITPAADNALAYWFSILVNQKRRGFPTNGLLTYGNAAYNGLSRIGLREPSR
jgi:hypothetical protein